MIILGSQVRDTVTGFSGIAAARTEWVYGCTRIGIESKKLHEGKPIETQWFDEQRVEIVLAEDQTTPLPKGGPQSDPRQRSDPSR